MTPRLWSIGITVLALAIALHALVPRYEWRAVPDRPYSLMRIDRWTGRAEVGVVQRNTGWHAARD